MAIMASVEQSLPLYRAFLTVIYQKWPLLTMQKGSLMARMARIEAPGALNMLFLTVP